MARGGRDGEPEVPQASPADLAFLEYLRLRERGESIDIEAFLSNHPDCADELREVISTFVALEDTESIRGEAPEPDSRLQQPLQGRYRIERFLAHGGMSQVYLATDLRTDAVLVVKILTEVNDPGLAERFRKEARVAGALSHRQRGTVRIIDVDALDDGTPYLVMEYVEGLSLAQRLVEGMIPPDETASILLRLCDTLVTVHASGIAHGDLKPSNIVLRYPGVADAHHEPVLIDFGVARVRGPLQIGPNTTSGEFRGTLRYAAPESLDGQIDALSDQFSLAVMAYEMLSGRHPFDTGRLGTLIEGIRTVDPPDVDSLNQAVPRRMALAIRRAMAKRREARFPNIAGFAAAFSDGGIRRSWATRARGSGLALVGTALLATTFAGYLAGSRWPLWRPAREPFAAIPSAVTPNSESSSVAAAAPPVAPTTVTEPLELSPAAEPAPPAPIEKPPDSAPRASIPAAPRPIDTRPKKDTRKAPRTRPLPAPTGFKNPNL
jgi:serine/threonine-protein kinase